jgi:hypothetical protein
MTQKFDEEITGQILRYEVWLEMTLRAFNGPESKLQSIQRLTPAAQRFKKRHYGIANEVIPCHHYRYDGYCSFRINFTRPANQLHLLRRDINEVREAVHTTTHFYSFQTITVHLEGTKISRHRKHSVKSDDSAGSNSARGLT